MTRLEAATIKYYKNPNYCKQCKKLIEVNTTRVPSEAKRMKFCCRSCAAKFNNTKYIKRVAGTNGICSCGDLKDHRAKTCHKCKRALTIEKQYQTLTKNIIYNGNARVKYVQIRKLARKFIKLWRIPLICSYCGYGKHVEICHIKSIVEFENDHSRVIDVNNPSNLICLCPNHHWELDHGYLDASFTKY